MLLAGKTRGVGVARHKRRRGVARKKEGWVLLAGKAEVWVLAGRQKGGCCTEDSRAELVCECVWMVVVVTVLGGRCCWGGGGGEGLCGSRNSAWRTVIKTLAWGGPGSEQIQAPRPTPRCWCSPHLEPLAQLVIHEERDVLGGARVQVEQVLKGGVERGDEQLVVGKGAGDERVVLLLLLRYNKKTRGGRGGSKQSALARCD